MEEIIGAIGDGAVNQKKTRDEAFLMAVKAVEQEAPNHVLPAACGIKC